MELPLLVATIMQKIKRPENVLLSSFATICQPPQILLCNTFIAVRSTTSRITSLLLWIFSEFWFHASIGTHNFTNFLVFGIIQEIFNTYILTGVAGNSSVDSKDNGSLNGAQETGTNKFLLKIMFSDTST